MKVLFRQAVNGVAKSGEIREVAEAYARNFLLPKGLAVVATPGLVADDQRRRESKVAAETARSASQREAQKRLEGVTVRLRGSASPAGKLFAAIKGSQVITELERQFSVSLDGIHCQPDHFKQLGSQPATLRWPDGQTTSMTVVIEHD